MAVDHRARVEELLAGYRRSREQLGSVHRALATVSESVTSDDGLVAVTVSGNGTLTGLAIHEAAYRLLRPADLAALIVRTTAAAAARATRTATKILEPVLPPGTDPEALLRGTADLTPTELAPPGPRQDGDESYENVTWMEKR